MRMTSLCDGDSVSVSKSSERPSPRAKPPVCNPPSYREQLCVLKYHRFSCLRERCACWSDWSEWRIGNRQSEERPVDESLLIPDPLSTSLSS